MVFLLYWVEQVESDGADMRKMQIFTFNLHRLIHAVCCFAAHILSPTVVRVAVILIHVFLAVIRWNIFKVCGSFLVEFLQRAPLWLISDISTDTRKVCYATWFAYLQDINSIFDHLVS